MSKKAEIVLIRTGHRYLDGGEALTEIFRDASVPGAEVYSIYRDNIEPAFERLDGRKLKLAFVNVGINTQVLVNVAAIERVEDTGCDDNVVHLKSPIARIEKDRPDSSTQLYTRATKADIKAAAIQACKALHIPKAQWPEFMKA